MSNRAESPSQENRYCGFFFFYLTRETFSATVQIYSKDKKMFIEVNRFCWFMAEGLEQLLNFTDDHAKQ